ncbi:MAG: UDP-N-acetylmuramate dehydrogenase [Deltaproteobacteria bacterium]|nr:UDP-N-acetylmuramate dehydrogenase [Deltaproteobacteria bacterium]
MDPAALSRLAGASPVPLEALKPLGALTSFKCGGPAALFGRPGTLEELERLRLFALDNSLPFMVLGGGNNVLFDDLGFRGLAARLSGELGRVSFAGGGPLSGRGAAAVTAGAGAALSEVADKAREAGRAGWARLRGIPGTVGGALAMNAGAGGAEVGQLVSGVTVLGPGGRRVVGREEAGFRYRCSDLGLMGPIAEAEFLLGEEAAESEILALERETLAARKARLPGGPSAGSVFRNPEGAEAAKCGGKSAGRLIEECGLKGSAVGGAVISPKHANVIVNAGGATSSEIRALAGKARLEVLKRHGVELVLEIRMLDLGGESYP